MKTISIVALLLSMTALTALTPSASAIICTTDLSPVDFCIGGGSCIINGDIEPCNNGVCADGAQVAGDSCTVDVPVYGDVCLGAYRPLGDIRDSEHDCLNTRDSGVVWFERCWSPQSYALFVAGYGTACFAYLP